MARAGKLRGKDPALQSAVIDDKDPAQGVRSRSVSPQVTRFLKSGHGFPDSFESVQFWVADAELRSAEFLRLSVFNAAVTRCAYAGERG